MKGFIKVKHTLFEILFVVIFIILIIVFFKVTSEIRFKIRQKRYRQNIDNARERRYASKKGTYLSDIEKKDDVRHFVFWFALIMLIIAFLGINIVDIVRVDGNSMNPYLVDGNHVIEWKIPKIKDAIERYDIVVFENESTGELYIKRTYGLPGETIQIIDGEIFIDNKKIEDNYRLENMDPELDGLLKEPVTLNEDEYFVLGDNRNRSTDSRIIGPVKLENIRGRNIPLW